MTPSRGWRSTSSCLTGRRQSTRPLLLVAFRCVRRTATWSWKLKNDHGYPCPAALLFISNFCAGRPTQIVCFIFLVNGPPLLDMPVVNQPTEHVTVFLCQTHISPSLHVLSIIIRTRPLLWFASLLRLFLFPATLQPTATTALRLYPLRSAAAIRALPHGAFQY